MNHIVDTCPLTKSEGGLNPLHEADDDAVIRLESAATAALAKKTNRRRCCIKTRQLQAAAIRRYIRWAYTAEVHDLF